MLDIEPCSNEPTSLLNEKNVSRGVKRGSPVKSRQKSSSTKGPIEGTITKKMVWASRGLNRHICFAVRHRG